ncbi:MAG: TonB-dependent receptor [Acidobacteria bacterium]|nr:TonB-dependent receptor [Acidobacteriota bacterium]
MSIAFRKRGVAIAAAVLLFTSAGMAQVDTGVLTGVVKDNAGAVIAGAKVTIRNTGTNAQLELITGASGSYVSPPLPSGNYRIEVMQPGFRTAARAIPLNVSERLAADFTMEIGAVTETVNVQELAPVLQTETTTISTQRSEQEIKSIPVNSRNFAELVRFTPGVVPGQAVKLNLALSQQRGNVSNAVNGSGFGDNNYLVDGLQNNNNHQGWGLINYPEFEAMEQYRIDTSVPDARFGRSGGTVQVGYKSGTNQFHGVLFEFLRNSTLDARNFFAVGDKPSLKRNMFGGTLGGPINSKTFFFLSYEGQRSRQGLTFLSTVPSASMRTGDFSELLAGARPFRIYDPLTQRGNVRELFPNNVIPAARIDATSRRLIGLYPAPNQPGIAANHLLNPSDTRDSDQGSVKIDREFHSGSRAYFRLTRGRSNFLNTRALGPQASPYIDVSVPVTQGVLSHTQVISPRLINQARFGISREPIRSIELNGGTRTAEEYGIQNVNIDELTLGLPAFAINGFETLGAKDNIPAIIVSQNTEYSDNLDAIFNKHSLKMGFNVVFRQTNAHQAGFTRGQFVFSTLYTSNPAAPANTGYGGADFLLGKPQQVSVNGLVGTRGLRRSDWAAYIQDDWKVTQKFTINLGLRYELPMHYPHREVAGRLLQFDIESGLPAPVGTGKYPTQSGTPTDKNNWGPRAGFAWQVGKATVIRSAYGIYYSMIPVHIGASLASNPPLFLNSLVANNQNDFIGARSITQGPVRSTDPNTPGQNRTGIDPSLKIPYIQQWNFAVQRQLPGTQQMTVAYVGTKGTGLLPGAEQNAGINFNQAVPGDGAVNSRRRWPNYGTVAIYQSRANSTYHSLQATLVKRWANSMHYQFGYTWAHLIDDRDMTLLPITDLRGAKANGTTDVRHQMRATFGYEIPWAKKKLYGGWEINTALTLYSGFPFSVNAGSNSLNIGEGTLADRLRDGNLPVSQRTIERWFDLDAFANPGFRMYGNSGKNVLVGPGTKALDLSLFKNFQIRESMKLQFRAETFNFTNTPQFNQPVGSIGAVNSGRITSAGSELTLQRTPRQIQFALKLIF